MRLCRHCKKELIKRNNEMKGRFINRVYCDTLCKRAALTAKGEERAIIAAIVDKALHYFNFGRAA